MNDNVLWLIAARSGSKSIANKNIKLLDGIPLINYKIKTALSVAKKENVWVSTDSEEYADIAIKAGATVPFIRPSELANDHASSSDVVLHAMDYSEQLGFTYSTIGLLEPTSPFVYYEDILKAIKILNSTKEASSIVAVEETRPNTFFIQDDSKFLTILAARFGSKERLDRQAFKKQITPSGGFYISQWDAFKKLKTFYSKYTLSYILQPESALEIDEPIDWEWAEFLLANNLVVKNKIYTL